MFILIWGSRVRVVERGSGEFYCPECDQLRPYSQRRVARYFTLFWLPVVPTQHFGDYVECHHCGNQYSADILDLAPPTPSERAARRARADLDTGMPSHMVERKLLDQGLGPKIVDEALAAALGPDARVCQGCGFLYRATVRSCSNCGGGLEDLETLP